MTDPIILTVPVSRKITGTSDDNVLHGTSNDDTIRGLDGRDSLYGYGGNDRLIGGNGRDSLFGGDGDDYLNPGVNTDPSYEWIDTGSGNDTVDLSGSAPGMAVIGLGHSELTQGIVANINGKTDTGVITKGLTEGVTTLINVAGALEVVGEWGGIEIFATAFDDIIRVNPGDNGWIGVYDYGGSDTIRVGDSSGFVRLSYGSASSSVVANLSLGKVRHDGFGFSDDITGPGHINEFQSSDFDDRIIGSGHDEQFILRAGNDTLDGRGGIDLVRYDRYGVDSVDVDLRAGTATGTWGGKAFSHTLSNIESVRGSRADNDTLLGNSVGNTLDGRGGDDRLEGFKGKDILIGGDGNDILFGGNGNDVLYGDGNFINFVLSGRASISPGRDILNGGAGNDILIGGGSGDTLKGGKGDDHLNGGGSRDTLIGGVGNDRIDGGKGNDVQTGSGGADTFIFSAGHDVITDFDALVGREKIDLSNVGSIVGFKDLKNNHLSDGGGNVVIDDHNGNTLTLNGVDLSDLDKSDFIF